MEKITNINEFADWIYNNGNVSCPYIDDNSICFQGACNSSINIDFGIDDTIDEIIFKTIETLESFDADDEFMELWSKDFANHNHFKPSQFIRILQEDEGNFKELAEKLREIMN